MPDIFFYNSLSRKKETFIPFETGKIKLYTCGPTVYYFQHIGNMRSFLFADILRRTLELNGYEVNHIMNITDVGHLVSDEDDGEDKMEKGARREGKTVWEIAEMYSAVFFEDLKKLNVITAKRYSRASEHIEEQIEMIQKLEKNGFTYETDEAIYFDVSKISDYTLFTGQKLEERKIAVREEVKRDINKRNPQDFALWFRRVGRFANHAMYWASPWGNGFPGWHIECSAMSTKYLGDEIDIHTGGEDHIPVHHTNERAQNMGVFGKEVVRFWMHNGFLVVDGEKMAKSLGNVYTISQIEERGFDPLAFRYFVLGAHYKTQLNFTWEALEAASNALQKLREKFLEFPDGGKVIDSFKNSFLECINDDLNTPKALAILWDMLHNKGLDEKDKKATLLFFDRVLGFSLKELNSKEIPQNILALMRERDEARKKREFDRADKLRRDIEAQGFLVEDNEDGTKVRPKL